MPDALLPPLREAAEAFADWAALPALAEAHGLGPLLYTHLHDTRVDIPTPTMQALRALYLRHRSANAIRHAELATLFKATEKAGVRALLLKGAALSYIAYPDPALRPMRDIDILVPPDALERARGIMTALGFSVPPGEAARLSPHHHHLPVYAKEAGGMLVSIEIHHRRLIHSHAADAQADFDALWADAFRFEIDGVTVRTLPVEEMLWHTCQHGLAYPMLLEPFRLKDFADMVSLVEKHHDAIDWPQLTSRQPCLLAALQMVHYLTPLSAPVAARIGVHDHAPPCGVGELFDGAPRQQWTVQRASGKSIVQLLCDTFIPSEWWLRLYYGIPMHRAVRWHRTVRHPLHMLCWGWRCLFEIVARNGRTD
ncbi:MAG: nucleotidyltransferase family protein [Lentisphaerae bacterium]|nr:nucleotidyltransferase family protein [Lentisphaerota bacterium]